MKPLLVVEHRPWPLPSAPWIMRQVWNNLLFAHWPLSPEVLRPLIPAGLNLDTFEGRAWVGVVPFFMTGVTLRFVPPTPLHSRFAELNVRTYVTVGDRPGVYFFSLEAANPLAVAVARRWYNLPYMRAKMRVKVRGDEVSYYSRRTHRNEPPAEFEAIYGPTGEVYNSRPGTLESWLTERYCLYTTDRRQRVVRGEIHHVPWPLQPAQASIKTNSMAESHGIRLPETGPVLHYTRRIQALAWQPKVVML
jgi:uncharacterized protein YqjF (DUF2071 family)